MDAFMDWEVLLRLLLAALAGGLIGVEREVNNRPAGLKTHLLLAVGSALVMMVSIFVAEEYGIKDHSRIAAQVVSGIGFLGAGTIMIRGFDVQGLTTAATLWVDAAIGLSIGAGFYSAALFSSAIVLSSLIIFGRLESRLHTRRLKEILLYTTEETIGFRAVNVLIEKYQGRIEQLQIEPEEIENPYMKILRYKVFFGPGFAKDDFINDLKNESFTEKLIYEGELLYKRDNSHDN